MPCAQADEWSRADLQREAAYLALHITDYAQTRTIAQHPEQWHEQNSILGLHPSAGQVDRYFLLTGIAHVALAHLLPADWRKDFQVLTIGIEFGAVSNNFSLGISATF